MINLNKQRKAFSMITAVLLILLVSSIAAYVLNLSGKMVHETVIQYKKEQSILYAKSYTSLAILAAISNDCVNSISSTEGTGRNKYNIKVDFTYIGNEVPSLAACIGLNSLGGAINHVNSKGNSVIIDVEILYDEPFTDSNKKVRYFRRTIQKL